MKKWHTRLQIFMLFFIETTSYIQEDDPIWEIGVLVKRSVIQERKVVPVRSGVGILGTVINAFDSNTLKFYI